MNTFAYQAYYEYSGPTSSSPFRTPKSEDEVQEALSVFAGDLCHFLSDPDAQVTRDETKLTPNSIVVVIVTKDSENEVDDAVARCLSSLDLFGNKIPQP
jgi:hypothetical protein